MRSWKRNRESGIRGQKNTQILPLPSTLFLFIRLASSQIFVAADTYTILPRLIHRALGLIKFRALIGVVIRPILRCKESMALHLNPKLSWKNILNKEKK